jgi:choline dehydrogenase
VLAVIKRSFPERLLPDLFCFVLLGTFTGYYPTYSVPIVERHNYLMWAVLKAHTNNAAGVVTLNSRNPRQRPQISFLNFQEGNDVGTKDPVSVVAGVKLVRKLTQPLIDRGVIAREKCRALPYRLITIYATSSGTSLGAITPLAPVRSVRKALR